MTCPARKNAPQPTTIRGVLYPTQRAASVALGVSPKTVHKAIQRGRAEYIGLGKIDMGQPCTMNGQRYPSQTAAANALGVRRATISRAVAEGRSTVIPGKVGEAV